MIDKDGCGRCSGTREWFWLLLVLYAGEGSHCRFSTRRLGHGAEQHRSLSSISKGAMSITPKIPFVKAPVYLRVLLIDESWSSLLQIRVINLSLVVKVLSL